MSRRWKVVLDENAVEFLLSRRAPQRRKLIRFFDHLKANPHETGDFVECDETGRALQVKILDRFMVTFWMDHPAKEVRIIEIESVD